MYCFHENSHVIQWILGRLCEFEKKLKMSEKIQMICGQYYTKPNVARHRKNCIPCKVVKSLNVEHKFMKTKIKDLQCLIIHLSQLLKENQINFEDKDILKVLDDKMSHKFHENSVEDKTVIEVRNSGEKTDGFIYLL